MKDLYEFMRKLSGNKNVDKFADTYFAGNAKNSEFTDFEVLGEDVKCTLLEEENFSYTLLNEEGAEYALVSTRLAGEDIYSRVSDILNEGSVEDLRDFLERDGSIFLVQLNESDRMSHLDPTLEGNFFLYKGKVYEVDSCEKGYVFLKRKGKSEVSLKIPVNKLEKEGKPVLTESTQTGSVTSKTQSINGNDIREGKKYELSDGTYKVDFIDGNKIYIVGEDGEYYVISKKDFLSELVGSLNEGTIEVEPDTYTRDALFVRVNGSDRLCTSDRFSGKELYDRVSNLKKISENKALAWLKQNTEMTEV